MPRRTKSAAVNERSPRSTRATIASGSSSSRSALRVQDGGAPTIRETSAAVSAGSSAMIWRAARANITGSGLLWWKFSANCIESASRREMPSTSVKRHSCGSSASSIEPHRGQAALAGEQLVGLLVLAGRAHERRVQEPGLADRDGQLVQVLERAGAHVGHRPHLGERRGDRAVLLGGGVGERDAAQVFPERLAFLALGLLAHLRDLFFGFLELVDGHRAQHSSRRAGCLLDEVPQRAAIGLATRA